MTEREWVKTLTPRIESSLRETNSGISVLEGFRLPYASEIRMYSGKNPSDYFQIGYETDILVLEQIDETYWKPRIIIETKIRVL